MTLSKDTKKLFEHKLKIYRKKEKYFCEKCYSDGKHITNAARDYNTYQKYKAIADDLEKLLRISNEEN